MITREDAIKRLDQITREIVDLKKAFEEDWNATPADATQIFLDKCGGWSDMRPPAQIIDEIYRSRTQSDRSANLFDRPSSQ